MGEQFSASDIVSAPAVYSASDIQGFTGNPARAKRQAIGGGQRTPAATEQERRDAGPPDNLSPLSPAYHVGAGVQQIGEGVARMGEPGWEKLGGASDIARGAMQVAAPFTLPTSLIRALPQTLLGLVGGGVAGGLTEGGLKLAGAPPGAAEAGGTAAGVLGGGYASRIPLEMPDTGNVALPGIARLGLRMIPGGRTALRSFDTLKTLADTMRPEEDIWKPFQPNSTTSRRMGSAGGNFDPQAESRGGGTRATRWKPPEGDLTLTPPPEPSIPGESFQRNPAIAKRLRSLGGNDSSASENNPSYSGKPRPRPSAAQPEVGSIAEAPPEGFDPAGWAKLTPQQQSTLRSAVEKGAKGRQPSAPPLTPPPGSAGPRTVTNTEWAEADPRNIAKDVVHWNAQLKNEKMANFYVAKHGPEAAAKLEALPDAELIQHLKQNGFDAPRKNAGSTQSMQRPLSQVRADIKKEIQTRLRLGPPPE